MPVSPETRVADGFDFELFNATPFDLSVKYRGLDNGREVWGARPVTVRSLASDKQHGNYNLVAPYVQTSPHDGGGLTRVGIRRPEGEGLAVDREHPRWTIAPEDLVSWAEISSGALGTATTFVNETLG